VILLDTRTLRWVVENYFVLISRRISICHIILKVYQSSGEDGILPCLIGLEIIYIYPLEEIE